MPAPQRDLEGDAASNTVHTTTRGCCGILPSYADLCRPVEVDDLPAWSQSQSQDQNNDGHTPTTSSTQSDFDDWLRGERSGRSSTNVFLAWPILGPLLFPNESSDVRDHCANERTFLSYLRLSVYMAVVAVAIALSFHLKSKPSEIELRMAQPLGIIFWILSVACLVVGFGNYITTINKYSRKAAIVQTGWRTQSIMSLIAICIIGTCIILLVVAKMQERIDTQP